MAKRSRRRQNIKTITIEQFRQMSQSGRPKRLRLLSVATFIKFVVITVAVAVAMFYAFAVLFQNDLRLQRALPHIQYISAENISWGSYRSQNYFGLRTKHSDSLLFGIYWYEQPDGLVMPQFRHYCDQNDRLNSYMWTHADGRSFGKQSINDSSGLFLSTDWVSHSDVFNARITGKQRHKRRTTLGLYVVKMGITDHIAVHQPDFLTNSLNAVFTGTTAEFDQFSINVDVKATSFNMSSAELDVIDPAQFTNDVIKNTIAVHTEDKELQFQLRNVKKAHNPEIVILQLNLPTEFDIHVAFNSANDQAFTHEQFHEELAEKVKNFDERFEESFRLSGKGYSEKELYLGQIALSNMLGSVGFFYGFNRVQLDSKDQALYGPHHLLTAVPSRPFFPRGFLWDEGFHNMLIRKFDQELSLEILTTWLNTMNVKGWIPREMILGPEAETKVPHEFIVQHPDVANPPSWFYVIWKMIEDKPFFTRRRAVFAHMYPKLALWFNWLRQSQRGVLPGTYRWRGRNATILTELNPKTLASGLDDYPRATHPSDDEYHLDLRCWMIISARVMQALADEFGTDAEKEKYAAALALDADFDDIVRRHWSEEAGAFVDFGNHSTSVQLARYRQPGAQAAAEQVRRKVNAAPTLRLVDDVFGYNSLYPLIARVVPPNSKYFDRTLDRIADENDLWTAYGLRSLSRRSPYYAQRNTEHDPPYWRGFVWINLNYLTLSALKHYAGVPGASQRRADDVFRALQRNVVRNLAAQLDATSYIWENYDDVSGAGRGTHPFTGWSSLVLMLMSDELDG